jgi:diadenosine tetraphosphatase ApaH/serine/threonine PP2A family protein phosphatase
MTILVLSDIHANLEALDAVLSHVRGFDSMWFLGDAVGYGPDPNACVERLIDLDPAVWLAGNHDAAALGDIDTSEFNPDAHRAAEWTREELQDDLRERLRSLPARIDLPEQRLTFVHGSPRKPIWEYILNASTALDNFEHFDTPLCFFGHTHVPVVYEEGLDGALRLSIDLGLPRAQGDARWLVNPGSVGQPRDGDPRASYLLFDPLERTVTYRRVGYDIGAVQDKILSAGLPTSLAARLDYGW